MVCDLRFYMQYMHIKHLLSNWVTLKFSDTKNIYYKKKIVNFKKHYSFLLFDLIFFSHLHRINCTHFFFTPINLKSHYKKYKFTVCIFLIENLFLGGEFFKIQNCTIIKWSIRLLGISGHAHKIILEYIQKSYYCSLIGVYNI